MARAPRIALVAALAALIAVGQPSSSRAQNAPPVITVPPTILAKEGTFFSVTVTATAQDPAATVTLTGPSPFCGMSFAPPLPGPSPVTGTFSGTPGFDCAGTFVLTFTASDGTSSTTANVTLTVQNTDRAPVVTAPAFVTMGVNVLNTFFVTASDPDGDAIASLTAAPLPSGATFTANASQTAGTFSWTPGFTQTGNFPVTFTAANALSGSATTNILVGGPDRPPVTIAPQFAAGAVGSLLTFTVSATDPDGEAIASLTASPLPSGATFSVNASNTSGTFSWTPAAGQDGVYFVTFIASNSLSGSATTQITIGQPCPCAPIVSAPDSIVGHEGASIVFFVSAVDPDGEAIASLTGAPLPAGATFTTNAANTSGTFSWVPAFGQAGRYPVTFTATNSMTGSKSTTVVVQHTNRIPIVTAPTTASTSEGVNLTFGVSAVDPDGDRITLTAFFLPVGASFVDHHDGTGTFTWTPSFSQSGTYMVAFRGDDGSGNGGVAQTTITVLDVNRPPIANAGGPYSAVVGSAIQLDGTGSSDPDGQPLQYSWTVESVGAVSGATPSVTFTAPGTFAVTLTVTDNGSPPLSDTATTSATVTQFLAALAFTTGGNNTIHLGSGKPGWCAQVEPVNGAFAVGDIVLSSVQLVYGSGQISALIDKAATTDDKNHDGIPELTACFAKTDLRTLFAGLPSGRTTVTVSIEGMLVSGGRFSADLTVIVSSTGATLAASVSPNPMNPSAVLTFRTTQPGPVTVRLYDLRGRLVREVWSADGVAAGYHDVRIDGKGSDGGPLASGVYFYRVTAAEGAVSGRITIMK